MKTNKYCYLIIFLILSYINTPIANSDIKDIALENKVNIINKYEIDFSKVEKKLFLLEE